MNWTKENSLYFLDLIRERPAIWDLTSYEYRCRAMRSDAFEDVARIMNVSSREVNTKWTSLKGQYNREKKKLSELPRANQTSAAKWFAYNIMEELMTNGVPVNVVEDYKDCSNGEYSEDYNKEWTLDNVPTSPPQSATCLNSAMAWHGQCKRETHTPNSSQKSEGDSESLVNKIMQPTVNRTPRLNLNLNAECDVFGQYVAEQLKNLHEQDSVLAQAEIHAVMTRYRLKKRKRSDSLQDCQTDSSVVNNNVEKKTEESLEKKQKKVVLN